MKFKALNLGMHFKKFGHALLGEEESSGTKYRQHKSKKRETKECGEEKIVYKRLPIKPNLVYSFLHVLT